MLARRILLSAILVLMSSTVIAVRSEGASATHNSTDCKWDFPWPRTISYYIQTGAGQFTSAEADRVEYGNSTWTEGGFNLLFTRVGNPAWATNYTMHYKGDAEVGVIAWTRVSPHLNCDRDANDPITRAETVWSNTKNFNLDCLAAGPSNCVSNEEYDIHNVSTHEVGHWFRMADETAASETAHTMYYQIGYGEYYKRSLHQHDKDSAWIMYGCRSGYVCH